MFFESYQLKLAKVKSDLLLKMKEYYLVLKEDRCFEEAKKIFIEREGLDEEINCINYRRGEIGSNNRFGANIFFNYTQQLLYTKRFFNKIIGPRFF